MRSLLSTEVGREKVGEGASEWLAKFGAARGQEFQKSARLDANFTQMYIFPVFTILVKRPPKTVDVASSSLCDRPHNEHDIDSIETDKLQGARPSLSLTPTIPTRLFS